MGAPCSASWSTRQEIGRLLLELFEEPNRLFVNRQGDATGFAVHAVSRTGRINYQGSWRIRSVSVLLLTGENQNVFISQV